MFAKLEGRAVLLVGGGEVALRKARLLLAAGSRLTLVAPALDAGFAEFAGRFTHLAEAFRPDHLDGQLLAVAATDNLAVNALVYQSANQRGLFVNVVDDPKRSSFIFPSIIDRSPVMVAVSSGGKAPVLVRLLRERLESLLPAHLGGLAELSGRIRERAKRALTTLVARRRFWERAYASNTLGGLIEKGEWDQAEAWLDDELTQSGRAAGEVVLVGAGPGDAGLLTLKGLQQIQQAEVVLYDQLVSPEILNLVRRDATLVSVGKKAGAHSVPQEETNRLLVEYAKAGHRVVRLNGGGSLHVWPRRRGVAGAGRGGHSLLRGAGHHGRRRGHRLRRHSAHPPRLCPERHLHHRSLPGRGQPARLAGPGRRQPDPGHLHGADEKRAHRPAADGTRPRRRYPHRHHRAWHHGPSAHPGGPAR
ncbi:Sirohydrochlorin ferrochelatase [Aeromonas diversa CDC 2478-85]|uniref:Sirohydrochlorin ferrochelatase n=1 Tax=Aeromonas diversa CDC 2478-85 TaxID=1268237 RepID=N9VBL3_9GAMM|nr:Sirohydrochlorin ferrochelatase [Aeromonas diversa CDC 2478-85]